MSAEFPIHSQVRTDSATRVAEFRQDLIKLYAKAAVNGLTFAEFQLVLARELVVLSEYHIRDIHEATERAEAERKERDEARARAFKNVEDEDSENGAWA